MQRFKNYYLIYTTDGTDLESVTIAYEEYVDQASLFQRLRVLKKDHGELLGFIVIEGRQVMVDAMMTRIVGAQ